MAENIFTKLVQARPLTAAGLQAGRQWFREAAQRLSRIGINRLFEQNQKDLVSAINISSIGSMFTFSYDPKWKEKLPYYDLHPLIFVVEMSPGGFTGINLHYLSPYNRAILMDALYGIAKKEKDMMKLQLSYRVLKGAASFSLFKPCYKKYLTNHVRSSFLFIEPSKWDMAIMLPTARFVKQPEEVVWAASGGD